MGRAQNNVKPKRTMQNLMQYLPMYFEMQYLPMSTDLLLPTVPEIVALQLMIAGVSFCKNSFAMTGTIATPCGMLRSFLQTHSLDRYRMNCGVWDRSVKPKQYKCKRLVDRESMLHRRAHYRHLCNSAEPDWDAEMSLFRKRAMKPNQMETVRRLEEEVDIGKVIGLNLGTTDAIDLHLRVCEMCCCAGQVLFSDDGLAILEGLNNDAPVGASLRFVSGASGWVHVYKFAGICMHGHPCKPTQSHNTCHQFKFCL